MKVEVDEGSRPAETAFFHSSTGSVDSAIEHRCQEIFIVTTNAVYE